MSLEKGCDAGIGRASALVVRSFGSRPPPGALSATRDNRTI